MGRIARLSLLVSLVWCDGGTVVNSATPLTIGVNLNATKGTLDFLYGVDHGPLCDSGVDVTPQLQSFGSSLIRTHDSGVLDWPVLFPHPNLDVSTSDPANYNFGPGDAYFEKIVNSGFEPYFRLGTSWGQLGGGLPPAGVPYNKSALIDVMVHTVMHYNDGWANGFTGKSVRFWEIWNEPDSALSDGRFWNRTAEDFYDLVDGIAKAVKAYDASLQVGTDGVALATGINGHTEYSWGLIDEIAKRNTPIDFYSWHAYTDNVDLYTTIATDVRQKLDTSGLSHVASHITEWFPCILCSEQDSAKGAATFGSTLARLVDAGVKVATLYPLCSNDENNRTGGHGWGLFDDETVPHAATWRRLTYVYQAFGDLAQTTETLLAPAVPSTEIGVDAIAARGQSGTASEVVKILVAIRSTNSSTIQLNVSGLSQGHTYRWSAESVSDAAVAIQPDTGGVVTLAPQEDLSVHIPIVHPSVVYVRIAPV
eukprot:m.901640 g.901640  ORF g.901640 m.901640 type:complete len:480 (+) comp23688_c0_seq11:34-1473(+)